MSDNLKIQLQEGVTRRGLLVFLAEVNPHSDEYRRYTVTLVDNGKQYICGDKGVYKSKASAKRIFDQVIAVY